MSSSAVLSSVRRLRSLMAAQQTQGQSDEQLLHTFSERGEEFAFATLVRRHGPMVLGVCRRILGHEQDAEDVFQATFLVLAQRAASLRNKSAVASFLYGTAYHLAAKAKRAAGRRRKYEGSGGAQMQPRSPIDPADELSWREGKALLDEEIASLPEKYRSVFVLCCLEELSQAEAGRRLGLKEGTVSSRLTEARKRLSQRLIRRGVELTAVLAASALGTHPASALPVGLLTSTVKAALATAAGEGLAGIVSVSVAGLVPNATAAMMASKAKIAGVLFLIAATSGSLVGLSWRASGPLIAAPESPAANPKAAPSKRKQTNTVEIQGRVLDPEGKPKVGAKLCLLDEEGKVHQLGSTAEDGQFCVAVPKESKGCSLLAQADGVAMDFLPLPLREPNKPAELRLVKDHAIRGQVLNTEGKPVAGVQVAVLSLDIYENNSLDSFLTAWEKRYYTSEAPIGKKRLMRNAAGVLSATTDAEGRFSLHGVGEERFVKLRFSGAGIAEFEALVVNRAGFDPKPYNQTTRDNTPKRFESYAIRWMLHGPHMSLVAEPEKPIRGIVKDAESGKGIPNVWVSLTRDNDRPINPWIQGKTDAEGRYELHGARKLNRYLLEVSEDAGAGYMHSRAWAEDTPGYQPITADIRLKKGVIITGKIIDGATSKPMRGFAIIDVLAGNPFAKEYSAFANSGVHELSSRRTAADGIFRMVAIPGQVLLMGGPNDNKAGLRFKQLIPDPEFPQYFDTRFPNHPRFLTSNNLIAPIAGNWCKVLDIKPDAQIVEQDIVLERASFVSVRIQDAEGKPLASTWVTGSGPRDRYPPMRCEEAICSAYLVETGKPCEMVFFHPERHLAGSLTLKGDEKMPVVATLRPTGAIKGRLLSAEGKPLANVVVDATYRQREAEKVHKSVHSTKQIVTDAKGAFTLDDLIPEQAFEVSFRRGKRRFERRPRAVNATIEVKAGECRDLGAIELKLLPVTLGE